MEEVIAAEWSAWPETIERDQTGFDTTSMMQGSNVTHLCGRRHACVDPTTKVPRLCSAAGVCEIRSELRRETRRFTGARSEFDYEFRTQQVEQRYVEWRAYCAAALFFAHY